VGKWGGGGEWVVDCVKKKKKKKENDRQYQVKRFLSVYNPLISFISSSMMPYRGFQKYWIFG